MWWPDRKVSEDPLEENELTFMCSEQTDFGVRGWNAFNFLRNSSTRTEIGASLLARMPKKAVNIGIDSSSTIKKGEQIIEHETKTNKAKLRDEGGALLLGGENSPLHRESPWRKTWRLMKDGDLWQKFGQTIRA